MTGEIPMCEWGDMYDFPNRPLLSTGDAPGGAAPVTRDTGDELRAEQIVEALGATLPRFERLIANRSADELRQAAQDGRWGVVEILSHLRDWEEVFHDRVARILDEERPELEDYDDTLWAIEHDYGSQDGHAVFARLAGQRQALIEDLRGLGDEAWNRTAVLAGEGETTLRSLMQWLVEHDIRHFDQARDVFC